MNQSGGLYDAASIKLSSMIGWDFCFGVAALGVTDTPVNNPSPVLWK